MINLETLVRKNHIIGLNKVKFEKDRLCGACEAGKVAKKHHSTKTIMTTIRPLEILHMDLFGPQNYACFGGNKYGLVIVVDDFLASRGFSFWMIKPGLWRYSRPSPRELIT